METIHARIKRLRDKLEISLEELARRVGVSYQTCQQWESGKTAPKRSRLPKVAAVLGVTEHDLLFGDQSHEGSSEPWQAKQEMEAAARLQISTAEFALLRDLRELLPEKRDRYAEVIGREADEARAYKAMVVERYGEAISDEVVAKHISPAPADAPRASEPQTLPGPVIDGDKAIRSGTLSWYSTAPRANAQKTRARK